MTTYRFLAYTLVAPVQAIAELPLQEVTYGRTLNDCGTFSAKLALPLDLDPDASVDPIEATNPNQVAIYVERDGVLVGGYIVRTRTWDAAAQSLTIGGSGFLKFYEGRLTGAVAAQTNADPVALARAAFTNAEAAGNSIGLTIGTEVSGALVSTAAIGATEAKSIIEYVNSLSKAGTPPTSATQIGFDYAIDVAWDHTTGLPARYLRIGYPRRGRTADVTGILVDTKASGINYTYPEEGAAQANSVMCVGQPVSSSGSSAGAALTSTATTTVGVGPGGFPLIQKSITGLRDISSQAVIDARAAAELAATSDTVTVPSVIVRGELDPPIGSFIEGDDIRVMFGPDPRFPRGNDTFMRLVGFSVQLSGPGTEEQVTLTLNELH